MFENKKAVVERWLSAVNGNKKEVWDSYMTMDRNLVWVLIGSTPASGVFEGLSEVNNKFQHRCWFGDERGGGVQGLDQSRGIPPIKVEEIVALEDGRVMVHCRSDAKGRNGVPYRNEYCWIITVGNDRITKLYEFCDTALIERAIFDKAIVPAERLHDLEARLGSQEVRSA